MAMKCCPDCGEKYSDTYKYCPFCEEEEILREEKESSRIGRRLKPRVSPITLVLIFLIAVMAVVLIRLLKDERMPIKKPSQPETPIEQPVEPAPSEDPTVTPGGPADTEPVAPTDPADTQTPAETPVVNSDAKLNREDMTLQGNESFRLTLSGVTTEVTWTSNNEDVATVSSNGTVKAVHNGMCIVQAKWDGQERSCIVRVVNAGSAAATTPAEPVNPTTPSTSEPSTPVSDGSLKTGAAKVANAGSGVYVRSGPGKSYEPLATLVTGNEVRIVRSAGDGWYEITFAGAGGQKTTGYMKGDYLTN